MTSADFQNSASVAVDYDPFAAAPLARVVPSTEPQREIWLAAKLEPEASLAYNESVSLRLRGKLDAAELQAALQALTDRHEALRATLSPNGEDFCIAEHIDLPYAIRDLSALTGAAREAEIAATLLRVVEVPFDLEKGPLLRAELLHLDEQDHLLVITAHHIVCDGWSWGVIVNDLAALYRDGTGSALPPADSFGDFALAQAALPDSVEYRDDQTYWLSRFTGPAPSLDLPTDRPRPRRRTFTSKREDRVLDAALVAQLKGLGAKHRASLYATLLSGFGVLLQRLSGQDDLVIGIPAAGQAAGGYQALVGHCVNVLPLRATVDPATPFRDILDRVRRDLLDAFDHRQYTLGILLKRLALARDASRLPLVSVLFNLDQALDESTVEFPGLNFEFYGNPRTFENFEFFINAVQVDGALRLECQYNSDLFRAETVRAWLDAYATLLQDAVANPAMAAGALALISEPARAMLESFQPERTPYALDRLAHEYFEAQVDLAPLRAAVRDERSQWNYADLDARANRIAHTLRARGVRLGTLVGLSLARTVDMVAAVLGTLKAGAGYVPLDPAFPAERLSFMVEDAALTALVVDDMAPASVSFPAERTLSLSRDADALDAAPSTRLARDDAAATADSVAYVIFTSGSTGKPKGVRVPHRSTSNFLTTMQRVPGMQAGDRLVAVTTLSFDIAFMELMLPLSVGAEIVIAGRDDVRDGAALRKLVEQSAATMMQATPAGWRILVDSGWQGHSGFKAVSGGEPLPVDLAEALLQRCGEVWNGYGPTETTVYSTYWRVAEPRNGIFIGRPVGNTTVRVLDAFGAQCPLGVPGELFIGGDGVTLGYLKRPELDAERFVPDPFSAQTGARRYRTGDRGRWLAQGQIEHLGRLDFQVKVRGYRIELGEIEANLVDIPEVARAVAVAREDRAGDVRLVAYVVASDGAILDEATLQDKLKARLPDYMVPQHFIVLDAIPLLPNGKIDRKALPAPQRPTVSASERVAPRNEREQRIASTMEEILALPELGIHDDFFALGGHSLLAAQLTAKLNREFGVTLSLRTLFDAPTIEGLAGAIGGQLDSGRQVHTQPIVRRADQTRAPLSLMQQRLWFLEEMNPGRVTYNTPSAHRLRGRLDEAAFERAFAQMMQRQPILRTAIRRDGDQVVQIVEPNIELKLFPAEDLSALPENQREQALLRRLQELTDIPFDLTRAPLFRAHMFRLGADDHALFFMPHHIIWDGWSFDIFSEEMTQIYRAYQAAQKSPLAELPVSYGDFAAWHEDWRKGPQFQDQLAFWRERLAQAKTSEDLPTDKPRKPGMSGEGRTLWISIPGDLTRRLRELARNMDATLNMVMLALYYVVLHASTGQRELVIATPVRGRSQVEVESIMGFFTNLLPLPMSVDPELPFVDFVQQVKKVVIDGFGNPDIPLEELQRELRLMRGGSGGTSLYQALFSFQDARRRATDWGGLQYEQILLFQRGATEDLGLWFLEKEQGMSGGVTYNADILGEETAALLRERYLVLLDRIVAEPRLSIAEMAQTRKSELEQIKHWNDRDSDLATQLSARELFEAHADRSPDRIALTFGSWSTSYAKIEQRANQIADCLVQRGVVAGSPVGLCSERGLNWLAAMLGIFKVRGVCVLLDPTDPAARLKCIIADADIGVMLGESKLEAILGWPHQRALWFDADAAEIVAATSDGPTAHSEAGDAERIAIAIYLPDASGQPRGVGITQRALVNVFSDLQRRLDLSEPHVVLGTASPATDTAVLEALFALSIGARFIQVERDEVANGQELRGLLESIDASVMFAPAEIWQAVIDAGWTGSKRLNAVCVSGTLSPDVAEKLGERCAGVWNIFGSPEIALVVSLGHIVKASEGVHAGQPIANTNVWVVDAKRQSCSIGSIGEIFVGGAGIHRGFGRGAGSNPRFVASNPVDATPLVSTGYRGRWRSDGNIELFGRLDRRLSLGGRLVEPAELESVLLSDPAVARVAVISQEARSGRQLAAYVVSAPGIVVTGSALLARMAAVLPRYALPSKIALLDAMPTLPGGAIDMNALSTLAIAQGGVPEADIPATASEQLLAEIWRELLHLPRVGIHDNFFEIGGDSLLGVDLFQRVQSIFGVNLPLSTLFTAQTIAHQARAFDLASASGKQTSESAHVSSATSDERWSSLVAIQPSGDRPPFFCVHALGGNVLNYRPLARVLGGDQPFYGLQAVGLDGTTLPLRSLQEMAAHYRRDIRARFPRGPYYLGGGSMGGMIAFELAQQLLAEGEEVALLAMFDTYGPGIRFLEVQHAGSLQRMQYQWRERWLRMRNMGAAARWRMLTDAFNRRFQRGSDAVQRHWHRWRGKALPHDVRYRELEKINLQAYYDYAVRPCALTITLFRASQQPAEASQSRNLGWDGIPAGGIQVIELPGSHNSLIEQPRLGEALHEALRSAQSVKNPAQNAAVRQGSG